MFKYSTFSRFLYYFSKSGAKVRIFFNTHKHTRTKVCFHPSHFRFFNVFNGI